MQYFNPEQVLTSARTALKPALMFSMALTVLGAVLIFGLFGLDNPVSGLASLLWHFVGGVLCLFWVLFGLTALAHQLHCHHRDEAVPETRHALTFVWTRIQPLLLLPAWAAGGLLAVLLGEMLLLVLAKVPGLGLIWMVVVGAPLLLLNTVIAIVLLLALFNIAARVAVSDAGAGELRDALWQLLRHRLPELLIYNLGGVVASLLVAAVVLSPLWLGAEMTLSLSDYVAGGQVQRISDADGFWGGLAYLLFLLIFGGLLSLVAGVPGIVITDMTLLLHLELEDEHSALESESGAEAETAVETEGGDASPAASQGEDETPADESAH